MNIKKTIQTALIILCIIAIDVMLLCPQLFPFTNTPNGAITATLFILAPTLIIIHLVYNITEKPSPLKKTLKNGYTQAFLLAFALTTTYSFNLLTYLNIEMNWLAIIAFSTTFSYFTGKIIITKR